MSENAISISNLNDFIFCPVSIYFHSLDAETEKIAYQSSDQLNGTATHQSVDSATYTTVSSTLQGTTVYSERYDLIGKIDLFDTESGTLRERKKKIHAVYDGYVFQLYAQCLALREMGFVVNRLILYSMDDNKSHEIPLPESEDARFRAFEATVQAIKDFSFADFQQTNPEKCKRCIYEPLCSFSVKGDR